MDPISYAVPALAGHLLTNTLDAVSTRVRNRFMGDETRRAVQSAYETGIEAFIESFPEVSEDYRDVLVTFFRDPDVAVEFSTLLEPTPGDGINVATLRERLEVLGFDFSTLPNFSLERAVQALTSAFVALAAENPVLLPILSYQSLQRIEAQLLVVIAYHDQSTEAVETSVERWVEQGTTAQAIPDHEAVGVVQPVYQFASQRYIRYLGLGTSEAIPIALTNFLNAMAMTRDDWLTRSADTVELTMASSEFILTFEALTRVTQGLPSLEHHTPADVTRALGNAVVAELKQSILLDSAGRQRSKPEIGQQMEMAGIPYLVLGVPPELAPIFDVLNLALFPSGRTNVNRGQAEVFFESLEDAQNVMQILEQVAREAPSDQAKALDIILTGTLDRAFGRALFEANPEVFAEVAPSKLSPLSPEANQSQVNVSNSPQSLPKLRPNKRRGAKKSKRTRG